MDRTGGWWNIPISLDPRTTQAWHDTLMCCPPWVCCWVYQSRTIILGMLYLNSFGATITQYPTFNLAQRTETRNAIEVNSTQINLDTYRPSSSVLNWIMCGVRFKPLVLQFPLLSPRLPYPLASPSSSVEMKLVATINYNRIALSACSLIWAQYNTILIVTSLASLLSWLGLCTSR